MPHAGATILPDPRIAFYLPEVDARRLLELSDAPEVRAWTRCKVDEYKNRIYALFSIHNSVASINTLPNEVLREIFAFISSGPRRCSPLWMLTLGSICYRWREVLLATSEYWAQGIPSILGSTYDYGDKIRDLFLARSAPWALEILKDYSSPWKPLDWGAFKDHFDRITVFEVPAEDEHALGCILTAVASNMKRLEKLRIEAEWSNLEMTKLLLEWKVEFEAKNLPRLRHLEITNNLLCSSIVVPSLHTMVLLDPWYIDIKSLPLLLDALEKCPTLTALQLELTHKSNDNSDDDDDDGNGNNYDAYQHRILKRVVPVNLSNLCKLAVGGCVSDIHCFLSSLTFPSTAFVVLDVINAQREKKPGLILCNLLPRRRSATHAHLMLDQIDRLCFHWKRDDVYCWYDEPPAMVSMVGYIQGVERLRVSPAFELDSANHFLQTLALFKECAIAELALDLWQVPDDMVGEFWAKVFVAVPDLRRLELLTPTYESRAMNRDIATHYLAAFRETVPQIAPQSDVVNAPHGTTTPRRAVSLAWVLCADEWDPSHATMLEAALTDVEQVLRDHAESGIRIERLELYVANTESHRYGGGRQVLYATHVFTTEITTRLVTEKHVSRLQAAAEVVVVGRGRRIGD